jgi:tetratricopeptide (TPR) repeat protein
MDHGVMASRFAWMIAILFCLDVGQALAEPPPADGQERLGEARAELVQGDLLYRRRAFGEALVRYRRADQLAPSPETAYALARCHRTLGDRADALRHYGRYLALFPAAPNRSEVEDVMVELAATTVPTPAPTPVKESTTERRESLRSRRLKWLGAGLLGVGLPIIVTGIGFGVAARDNAAILRGVSGQRYNGEYRSDLLEGRKLATAAYTLIAVGTVSAGVGAGILLYRLRIAREEVRISALPGGFLTRVDF